MVATGTLRYVDGFEIGGLGLAQNTVGSPTILGTLASPGGAVNSVYALRLNPANTNEQYQTWAGFAASGVGGDSVNAHYLIGFHVRFSDLAPGTSYRFMGIQDSGGAGASGGLELDTNGDIRLENDVNTTVLTVSGNPLTVNTWHYFELAVELSATGAWELWIDGDSKGSGTSDFLDSIAVLSWVTFLGAKADGGNTDFDDLSIIDHTSTLQGNSLGVSEVFAYQQDLASQSADTGLTTNDSTTTSSNWSVTGQTPGNDSTFVSYDASAMDGAVAYDEGANSAGHAGGPNGGPYTLDGTIQGAQWIWRLERGGGGSSTHERWYGNSTDVTIVRNGTNMALGTSPSYRGIVSEDAAAVPLSTQYFAQGFEVSGARNLDVYEMWAMLLHTPPTTINATITGDVTISLAIAATMVPTILGQVRDLPLLGVG